MAVVRMLQRRNLAGVRDVLARAMPPLALRIPGAVFAILADLTVVALLGLSIWLLVSASEQPPILYLNFAIVGVRALAIGRAGLRYLERLANHDAAFAQLNELRTATFAALLPRVPGGLGQKPSGEVLANYVDDVDQLQDEPLRVRGPLLSGFAVLLLSVVTLALISPLAAAVTTGFMLAAAVLSVLLSRSISARAEAELSASRAALQSALLERISAAQLLAVFGATAAFEAQIYKVEQRLAGISQRAVRSAGLAAGLFTLCAGFATLTVLLLVGPELSQGWLTAPLFAVLVIVPAALAEVFVQVPLAVLASVRVRGSAAAIADLTAREIPAEVPVLREADPAALQQLQQQLAAVRAVAQPAPALQVRDFTVRYPGSATPVLDGVEFTVRAGELLVITGPSGSGKSTLANALVRFLEYQGEYEVYGVPAKQLGVQVRDVVGLCEQRPHIFNNTLEQNLLFAKPDTTAAELWQVLTAVGLREWAQEREGLQTQLGTAGALISGGQAQRIALARVLLRDFPIVVFDEPTAGVHPELAEQLLTELFAAVPAAKAVLLITHHELPETISARTLHLPEVNAS